MTLRHFYLLMCVVGALIPWLFFWPFLATHGPDIPLFVQSLFVNGAAGGFAADVLISLVVFWVWSFDDARRRGLRHWWLVLPASACAGLSLSLPLYLYMRSGPRPD